MERQMATDEEIAAASLEAQLRAERRRTAAAEQEALAQQAEIQRTEAEARRWAERRCKQMLWRHAAGGGEGLKAGSL